MNLQELVDAFIFHVTAQAEALERNMPGTGNRHAREQATALDKLRAQGDAGMKALATLLNHPRRDVAAGAAVYLLQHRAHEEAARKVLEDISRGEGLLAFGASLTLKRWAEGTLAPEPEVDANPDAPDETWAVADPARGEAPSRPRPGQPLELPDSLAPHRALLERTLAPCILFDKVAGPPTVRGCRYGGLPFLPPDVSWPRSPEGPLHFVGQLDFAELANCGGTSLPELPKDGLLAFFYDVENQPWGTGPADRAFWRLVYVPPGAELTSRSPPAELLKADRPVLPSCHLRPAAGLSLPDWSDIHAPAWPDGWDDEQAEELIELRRKLAGTDTPDRGADQVRGHPNWWQEDGRLDAQLAANGVDALHALEGPEAERLRPGAADWNLLWQVGTDEALGFVWGSYGTLYLLIRDEDLRACRFERAWLMLQCA